MNCPDWLERVRPNDRLEQPVEAELGGLSTLRSANTWRALAGIAIVIWTAGRRKTRELQCCLGGRLKYYKYYYRDRYY